MTHNDFAHTRWTLHMLVTVSGPPGAGKSSTVRAIAERFDLEHISGGDIFRELAAESGLSAVEFNARAEDDPEIDRDLDRRLASVARERDDVLLESRLAGWLAGDAADLRLWLDAPLGVRAARIADREGKSLTVARSETERRETSEAHRYAEYYDIDIGDRSIYDLTLNTARWSPDAVTAIVTTAVEAYTPATDEGAVTVPGFTG